MPRINIDPVKLKVQIDEAAAEQEARIGNDPWGGEGRYDWENRFVYKANNGIYAKTYRILNKERIKSQLADPKKEKFVNFNLNYRNYLLSVSSPECISKNADHCLAFKVNTMEEVETDEVYKRGEKKGEHKVKLVKPRLDAKTYQRLMVVAGNHYGATEARNGLTKIVKLTDGSISYAQADRVIAWVLDVDNAPADHRLCLKMVRRYEEQIGIKCCSIIIHKKTGHCTIQALFVLQKETKKEHVKRQMKPVLEIWNKMYPNFEYDRHCTQMNIKNPYGFDRKKSDQDGGFQRVVIMDDAEFVEDSNDAYWCEMVEDWSTCAIDVWSIGKKAVCINEFMAQKEWSPLIEDDTFDQELKDWLKQNEGMIQDTTYEVQDKRIVKSKGNKQARFKEGSRDHWVFFKRGVELVSKIVLDENRAPTYEELLEIYIKANQECVQKTSFGQLKGPLPDHQLKSQATWASKQPLARWREWCTRNKETRSQIHHAQTLIKCFIDKTNDQALRRKMTFASLGKVAKSRASAYRHKAKDLNDLQTDLVNTYTWLAEQEDRQSMFTHQMEVLFDHADISYTQTSSLDKVLRVLNAFPTRKAKALVLQEVSKVQDNQNQNNFRSFVNGRGQSSPTSFRDHALCEYDKAEEELVMNIEEGKDVKDWEKNLLSRIHEESESEIVSQNQNYNHFMTPLSNLSSSSTSSSSTYSSSSTSTTTTDICFDTIQSDIQDKDHIPIHTDIHTDIKSQIDTTKDNIHTPLQDKEINSMYTPILDTPRKEQCWTYLQAYDRMIKAEPGMEEEERQQNWDIILKMFPDLRSWIAKVKMEKEAFEKEELNRMQEKEFWQKRLNEKS